MDPSVSRMAFGKMRKGELTKYGYHAKNSARGRRSALGKALKRYPAMSVMRKLNALYVLSKNKAPSRVDQIMIKCGLSRDEFRLESTPCLISALFLSRDDEHDKVLTQASRECLAHLDRALTMQNINKADFVVMDLMKPVYGSKPRDAFNRR